MLGSHLGRAIGAGNVLTEIAGSTILGTLLENVGESLDMAIRGSLIDYNGVGGVLDEAITKSFSDIRQNFDTQLQGQIAGVLSSLLVAELADALDLGGFEGQVFSTAVNVPVSHFFNNVLRCAREGSTANLFAGFADPKMLMAGVGSAFGGLIGSTLADLIVTPQSPQGALFASAGSALGGLLAGMAFTSMTVAFPVVGPFLAALTGSFAGHIFGTLLGDDDAPQLHPRFGRDVYFNEASGLFLTRVMTEMDRDLPAGSLRDSVVETTKFMTYQVRETLNDTVRLFGGEVDGDRAPPVPAVILEQNHGDWEIRIDGLTRAWNQNNAVTMTQQLADRMVGQLTILGADPVMTRAFYASRGDGVARLAFDAQVARDFQAYFDNQAEIDALIAAAPDTEFAAKWVITLLRARELGLDRASGRDHEGGIFLNLEKKGFLDKLDWTPELDPDNPDAVVLTSLNHRVTMENVWGPGARVRPESAVGTDAGAAHNVWNTGGRFAVLGFDARGGDDRVLGHLGTDFLKGGAGDDSVRGGDGHDWLVGDDGNDTLGGDGGDDLLTGGDGNDLLQDRHGRDTFIGGKGSDRVEIGAGAGRKTVMAATEGSADQSDTLVFQGVSSDNVTVKRDGADLVLATAGAALVTVRDFFLTTSAMDAIRFTDATGNVTNTWSGGVLWSQLVTGEIREQIDSLSGTARRSAGAATRGITPSPATRATTSCAGSRVATFSTAGRARTRWSAATATTPTSSTGRPPRASRATSWWSTQEPRPDGTRCARSCPIRSATTWNA